MIICPMKSDLLWYDMGVLWVCLQLVNTIQAKRFELGSIDKHGTHTCTRTVQKIRRQFQQKAHRVLQMNRILDGSTYNY